MALTKVRGSGIDADGQEVILDADGDTTLTVDTDDRVDIKVAGTDTVHIDASGIGVNINNPLYPLHVTEASGGDTAAIFIDGPTNGTSALHMGDSDDIDIGSIQYDHSSNFMSFRTNAAERMRIDSNGDVGIGTTDPVASLHVIGGGLFTNTNTANTSTAFHFSNVLSNGAYRIRFDANNTVQGAIQVTTSGTNYAESSDYRLKENIVTEWDATTRLKQLKPSRFNFKVDKDKTVDGFIAHEVSSIVPEAVSGEKDAVDENGNIESQLMDKTKLIPLMVKTIQELEARIAALESK